MKKYVIDTNVAIVANGNDNTISVSCRKATVERLIDVVQNAKICIDEAGSILDEYRHHLNPRGQPGVGDRFYLVVINSHPDRVFRVDIRKRTDGEYEDLPQEIIDAGFDHSDRKFAAVAKKADAVVCNAVDSDWVEHKDVIERYGITIEFLCGFKPDNWRRDE